LKVVGRQKPEKWRIPRLLTAVASRAGRLDDITAHHAQCSGRPYRVVHKKWHLFGIWVSTLVRCVIFAICVYSRIIRIDRRHH